MKACAASLMSPPAQAARLAATRTRTPKDTRVRFMLGSLCPKVGIVCKKYRRREIGRADGNATVLERIGPVWDLRTGGLLLLPGQLAQQPQIELAGRAPPLLALGDRRTETLVEGKRPFVERLRLVGLGQRLHGGAHIGQVFAELALQILAHRRRLDLFALDRSPQAVLAAHGRHGPPEQRDQAGLGFGVPTLGLLGGAFLGGVNAQADRKST